MENNTKALVKAENKSPWTVAQINLIKKTVAKGATLDELGLFLYTAKKTGLDPLVKQIYFMKYGDQMTMITGIDGYLAIAERTKQLAGIDDAIFDDGFTYEPGKEPVNPSKASVTVYRMIEGQRMAFTATARWKEYKPSEKKDYMWKRMPYNQLSKCALALALRKAFPNDLSGIRTDDEMAQAQEIIPEEKTIRAKVINTEVKAEVVTTKTEKLEDLRDKICVQCGAELTASEANYSNKLYKKFLCRECQKGAKK